MKENLIIGGFPGIGKTTLKRANIDPSLSVRDLDPYKYRWVGKYAEGVINRSWPDNYIKEILETNSNVDVLMTSLHPVTIDTLVDKGYQPVVVYPSLDMKEEFLQRYRERGSCDEFVATLTKNFELFVQRAISQKGCTHIILEPGQYLTDIFQKILSL